MNTGINRIRLEFKGNTNKGVRRQCLSINRIRLEFKGFSAQLGFEIDGVLIESDWNLKGRRRRQYLFDLRINRIRLEFKGE